LLSKKQASNLFVVVPIDPIPPGNPRADKYREYGNRTPGFNSGIMSRKHHGSVGIHERAVRVIHKQDVTGPQLREDGQIHVFHGLPDHLVTTQITSARDWVYRDDSCS